MTDDFWKQFRQFVEGLQMPIDQKLLTDDEKREILATINASARGKKICQWCGADIPQRRNTCVFCYTPYGEARPPLPAQPATGSTVRLPVCAICGQPATRTLFNNHPLCDHHMGIALGVLDHWDNAVEQPNRGVKAAAIVSHLKSEFQAGKIT